MYNKKISYKNYRQHKEPVEISFEEFSGLIGVLGNNGSGKSTLVNGIPIALYGVDAIVGKKEYLRTQNVEKEPVVIRFEFSHESKDYVIEREFRGINLTPKANIYEVISDTPRLLASGVKEVNSYVEKIVNMDYKTFISTIFCQQKELDKLSKMDPSERRSFILTLSGVNKIEDEIRTTRELKRDADKYVVMYRGDIEGKDLIVESIENLDITVEGLKLKFKTEEDNLALVKKQLEGIEVSKKTMDEKYEQYNSITIKSNNFKNSLNFLNKEVERFDKEVVDAKKLEEYMKKDGYRLIDEHYNLQKQLEILEKDRVSYAKKQQIFENIEKIKKDGITAKAEVERLYKEATSIGYTKEEIPSLQGKMNDVEKIIDSIKSDIMTKQSDIRSLDKKINENNTEINKVKSLRGGDSSKKCGCPTCKQNISVEYVNIVEKHYNDLNISLVSEKEAINKELIIINDKLTIENTNLADLKKSEIELRNKERRYAELLAQYNTMRNQYTIKAEEYKKATEDFKQFASITFDEEQYNKTKQSKLTYDEKLKSVYIAADKVKQLDSLYNNLERAKSEAGKEELNLNEAVKQLATIGFNDSDYQKIKNDYRETLNQFNELNEDVFELKNELQSKDVTERKFLKENLSNVEKKEKEYTKYLSLISDYSIIEDSLIQTKESIMARINPLINKHFSEIFKTLLDDKYDDIELDADYNIFIYDSGEAFPLSRFSGGEQDLANLSLRLAISKFLAEVKQGNIEFIVLDEIFASLDDERKSSLLSMLGNLTEFFKQIFVISHEDVIKSSMDHYIMVRKNEFGYSEVEFEH